MSYCRWHSESDVYCYGSKEGWQIHLTDGRSFIEGSAMAAADMLIALRDTGVKVPEWAIASLLEEARMKSLMKPKINVPGCLLLTGVRQLPSQLM